MQFVIGIDGGGTRTQMKIASMDGKLLARCEGGPVNINSIGRHLMWQTLSELTQKGLADIGGLISDCAAVCLGIAGAGRQEEKRIITDMLKEIGYRNNVIIVDDAHVALYGGIGSDVGIVLIAGTGSICYGRNKNGESCRSGGWGYILGDEGSGYDIGLQALKHLVRSYDGREERTLLCSLVMERLKIGSIDEVIGLIYRSCEGRTAIAGLAPVVDEAYEAGDEYAKVILEKAASELFQCACSIIKALGFTDIPVKLVLSGSVLEKSKYIRKRVIDAVSGQYPLIATVKALDDAAWGAVQMALDQLKRKESRI